MILQYSSYIHVVYACIYIYVYCDYAYYNQCIKSIMSSTEAEAP